MLPPFHLATGAPGADGVCVLASVLDGFWHATASANAIIPRVERDMELPGVGTTQDLERARFSMITSRSVNAFRIAPRARSLPGRHDPGAARDPRLAVHDVGIATCLLALSDDARREAVPFEALGGVLDDVHEEASGLVTRLWGLPNEIQTVVATHHQLEVGGMPHPVNAALIVSEQLAGELDAGELDLGAAACGGDAAGGPPDSNPPELFDAACAALGLKGRRIEAARAEASEIVNALSCSAPENPAAFRSEERG